MHSNHARMISSDEALLLGSFSLMLATICAAPVAAACSAHAGFELAIKLTFFSAPCFALTTITACILGVCFEEASSGERGFLMAMIVAVLVIGSLVIGLGWLLFHFPLPASY